MIVGMMIAAVITGAFLGWVIALVIVSAQMSYTQQRMQRKVRYWQAQAALAHAQARAERLARKAVTQDYSPSDPHE